MSRTRRNFSAKFKSELVIELLKGEKRLKYNRNRKQYSAESSPQLEEGVPR